MRPVPCLASVGERHASGPCLLRLTRVSERVPGYHKVSETVLIGKNLLMVGAIA